MRAVLMRRMEAGDQSALQMLVQLEMVKTMQQTRGAGSGGPGGGDSDDGDPEHPKHQWPGEDFENISANALMNTFVPHHIVDGLVSSVL